MSLVQLENIGKTYRTGTISLTVLSKISLSIRRGEMIAITGPSGSGKSSLMNIIGLLDRPSGGKLYLKGEEIDLKMPDRKLAAIRSQTIGFVFQSFNLLSKISALNNVLMPVIYNPNRQQAKSRAKQILEELGLGKRLTHRPYELSGGEQQRVAIARALINNPEIILADEPTGNLDSKSGQAIMEIFHRLNQEGKTVVIITHDEKVSRKCQRIIRLADGEITKEEYA